MTDGGCAYGGMYIDRLGLGELPVSSWRPQKVAFPRPLEDIVVQLLCPKAALSSQALDSVMSFSIVVPRIEHTFGCCHQIAASACTVAGWNYVLLNMRS